MMMTAMAEELQDDDDHDNSWDAYDPPVSYATDYPVTFARNGAELWLWTGVMACIVLVVLVWSGTYSRQSRDTK